MSKTIAKGFRVSLTVHLYGPTEGGADPIKLSWLATFVKEIELPFPPFPGLSLGGHGKISDVLWIVDDARFSVTLERDECGDGIYDSMSFAETADRYLQDDWSLVERVSNDKKPI